MIPSRYKCQLQRQLPLREIEVQGLAEGRKTSIGYPTDDLRSRLVHILVLTLLSLLYSISTFWTVIVEFERHVLNPDVFRIWSARTWEGKTSSKRTRGSRKLR